MIRGSSCRKLRDGLGVVVEDFPGGAGALVERLHVGPGHVDFAAHFETRREPAAGQAQRNGGYGAHIGGDVLTGLPVAASGCQRQAAVVVGKRHGDAIDLRLAGEGHGLTAEPGAAPVDPLGQLSRGAYFVEGQHGNGVGDGGNFADRS